MMNIGLWIIQALLAVLFLFAGGVKLITPLEEMLNQMNQMPISLPGWFLRFTGVVEVLGALGLILPWLTNIRRELTPLAAAGLVVVMIGAVILTALSGDLAMAVLSLAVGILCAFVAYGRWQLMQAPGAGT
jgi:uncharacterized membrane protein YphA (DoxX/SURF4 family)